MTEHYTNGVNVDLKVKTPLVKVELTNADRFTIIAALFFIWAIIYTTLH